MDDRRVAVVVGAGASGVLATMRLLATGWCVVLVDPHAGPGRGVADSTASPWHLLNCPVSAISAHPDRPDDFLTWYRMRRCPNTQPCDFVPRHQYGDYLSDTLRQADSSLLTVHRASVTRIFESTGSRLTVLLADGVVIQATHVVLALGHAPAANPLPLRPEVKNSPSYVADPWRRGALTEAVSAVDNGQVLLIGAGLTAYDVTQSLVRANSAVRITAVSRHGLTPQPHRRGGGPTVPGAPVTGGPLSHLLRQLRQMAAGYGDWQAVIDAHRPHWNTLWDGLSEPDRDRFLRHVSRWWELHGHRVPPAVERRSRTCAPPDP